MSARLARIALLWLAAASAVLLAGCASHTVAAQQPAAHPTSNGPVVVAATATTVHVFRAFTPAGAPTVAATGSVRGYCWNSSLATTSRDAFRCFSGSMILDPCFAPATADPAALSCVTDPWSKGITLHLTRTLPNPVASGTSRPWALQLATGARCVASTGVVPAVGGVNLGYHCSDGTAAQIVNAASAPMTADYAKPGAAAVRRSAVTAIWRS